jgi:hypothetical protein
MTDEALRTQAATWAAIVPADYGPQGPAALLATARKLYVAASRESDFLWAAALVAFQAIEAAFRLLPADYDDRVSFDGLIRRAQGAGLLNNELSELMHSTRELRNLFAHPMTTIALETDDVARMLEASHYLVVGVMSYAGTLPT